MLVYKYVVPERIDVLESGCIRFTQAAALNDPFENYPCFRLFNKSLEERSRRVLKSAEGRFDAHSMVLGEIMIPKMVRDRTIELQRDLSSEYPLLSLSKKRNNLLLWSHYSNSHRGFVIGFDSGHPFFHKEKPRRMTHLGEVKYSSKRLVLPAFEDCGAEEVYEIVFFTKSHHWSYEEELRMLAQPTAADTVLKGNDGFDIYLYRFPPECLKEVILGHLMKPSLKEKISAIVSENYPHAEILETRLNETDFDLDIVPYRTKRLKAEGAG